jgi:hypothetical protein
MITGMRGLCNGLGPAVFGLIFYIFHVDLNADEAKLNAAKQMMGAGAHNNGGIIQDSSVDGASNITVVGLINTNNDHQGISHVTTLELKNIKIHSSSFIIMLSLFSILCR